MGVAIILAPLMLLIFLTPFLYILFTFLLVRFVFKRTTNTSRTISIAITLIIFSFYPVKLYLEYLKFTDICDCSRPPVTTKPINQVESIAFVTEGGDSVHEPFVWPREMNLNLNEYEYAYIVNGKETMRNICKWDTHKCEYGGDITSRYMFLVTTDKKNGGNIFQSDIKVVDRLSGRVLYEANEFVLTGLLPAYHGAFLAKPGHRGYLSCGYLDGGIDVWRPNDSNASRHRYAKTDTMVLTKIFPSLKAK